MKLSELGGKEIVNLNNGCHLGIIANSDIVINEETGQIWGCCSLRPFLDYTPCFLD